MSGLPPSKFLSHSTRAIVIVGALVYFSWRFWILMLAARFEPAATVDIILDDAYYYLEIAYNLGASGRSTFDGITATNGYQPAWMALIAAIEVTLRLDKKPLFVALQALMFVTLGWPIVYCLRRARDPFFLAAGGGLLASYGCFPGVFTAGLETALFAPAFVALLAVTRGGLGPGADRAAWLFAAIVMIRLDALSLWIAYALPLAHIEWKASGPLAACRRILRFSLPLFAALALYALGNWLLFDSPVPLSGVAKAIGAVPLANWGILYNYVIQAVPVLITAAMLLPIELMWSKFEGGRFYYQGIGLLAISLTLHYGYYAAFSGWIPWPWYFYAYALMMALMVARLIEIALRFDQASGLSAWPRRLSLGFVLVSAWLVAGGSHILLTRQIFLNHERGGVPNGSFNRRNVADALQFAAGREKMVVAIGDRAAGLGYWSPSDVKVFALEGLVSDRAYLSARVRDQGERWVTEQIRPRYLIIDRETLEPVRIGDQERYVVIEPIQGRVVMDHLLTFCFPKEALVRQTHERDDQLVVLPAPAVRSTFDFQMAVPCSGAFAEHAQRQILSEDSLRKTAVGVEYAASLGLGGQYNDALERFDRALALRVRRFLQGRAQ
jgi:hypothetical protein